jgi:hypothetical protein
VSKKLLHVTTILNEGPAVMILGKGFVNLSSLEIAKRVISFFSAKTLFGSGMAIFPELKLIHFPFLADTICGRVVQVKIQLFQFQLRSFKSQSGVRVSISQNQISHPPHAIALKTIQLQDIILLLLITAVKLEVELMTSTQVQVIIHGA